MLANHDAIATIAVKDLAAARDFYEGKLGLNTLPVSDPEVLAFQSGRSKIFVYRSQYAGTNQATVATWSVDEDLGDIVQALKAKGVTFEHYDLPMLTLQGDIHVGERLKVVWLKDPDGNILSIVQPLL